LIESPARIRRIEGVTAWVVSEAPASCGACAGKGCGSSVFARFWHADQAEYPVTNHIGATAGEAVIIGLPEGALLQAALTTYGTALLMLFVCAVSGKYVFGEPGAILGGLSGLALAALWIRLRPNPKHEPVVLRRGTKSSCQTS
jgi:sigma-E factor negative regulatory protein RseC